MELTIERFEVMEKKLDLLEKRLNALRYWTYAHDLPWGDIESTPETALQEEDACFRLIPSLQESACFRLVPEREEKCHD